VSTPEPKPYDSPKKEDGCDITLALTARASDFRELLAVGNHRDPSVVLLRGAPDRPQDQAALPTTAHPLAR
jgi:hypothetical protein